MNISPLTVVYAIRALLLSMVTGLISIIYIWCVSPTGDNVMDDRTIHLGVMFLVAVITYAAYPKMRRSDLTAALIALMGCVELIGFSLGRHGALMAWLADSAGALLAFAPTEIEQFRRLARTNGYVSLGELARQNRRRLVARRRPAQLGEADVYGQGMTSDNVNA